MCMWGDLVCGVAESQHCPLVSVSGGVRGPAGPVPTLHAVQGPSKRPREDLGEREREVLPSLPALCVRHLQALPKPRDRWEKSGLRPRENLGRQISLPR